jgi:short-subunit dehydrogenase
LISDTASGERRQNLGQKQRSPAMVNSLRNKTVVITGASSGMGLAAAHAFAHRGSNLVLAARREEPLRQAAHDCEALGVRAIAVPSDVTDPTQMRSLAQAAVERFGQIDVWINNAGLSLWGPFAGISIEAQNRLVEVNLMGVIINMASIGGRIPIPFSAAYSASKFGVKGFTEALRYELAAESNIEVCGLYPSFVDTPTNIHSANYTGRALRPVPPVLSPERLAEAMVSLALRPRRALHVGMHHALAAPYALAPEATGRLMGRMACRLLLESGPPAEAFDGTLFEPVREGVGVRGGWGLPERRRARNVSFAALAAIAGVSALLAGAWGLSRQGRGSERTQAGS